VLHHKCLLAVVVGVAVRIGHEVASLTLGQDIVALLFSWPVGGGTHKAGRWGRAG
jgi:hypothetical protein